MEQVSNYNLFLILGKTTLIGVLTGLLNPNSGTAEICNYNIEDQMDQIRLIMGVCPQFDILWDELTAEEHLYMFSKLKSKFMHNSLKLSRDS